MFFKHTVDKNSHEKSCDREVKCNSDLPKFSTNYNPTCYFYICPLCPFDGVLVKNTNEKTDKFHLANHLLYHHSNS
jgi:hypothetical protein